jgi:hypothetical protein
MHSVLIHDPRGRTLPIFLINPARKAAKKRTPVKGTIRRVPSISKGAKKPSKKKPAARKGAKTNPQQGKKKMAKKLYGAAAAARKKRLAKLKRKRTRTSGRKRNPAKDPKKVAAGKKGAAAKKRKAQAKRYHSGTRGYAAGMAAYKKKKSKKKPAKRKAATKRKAKRTKASYRAAGLKAARTRKRNARGSSVVRKRKAAPRKRKRTRAQAARYGSYGLKGQKKSRKRTLRAQKRKGAWRTRKYMSKHGQLKVNPSGKEGGMMGAVKQVLPIAGSFYVSRLVCNKLSDVAAVGDIMDKLNVGGFALGKPALSGLIMAGTHYGTKNFKAASGAKSAKMRTGLMLGTALAFVDSLIATFAPPDVKALIGVPANGGAASAAAAANDAANDAAKSGATSTGEYVPVSEYINTGEYVSSGEYVPTDAYEEHAYGTSLSGYPDANEDPHGLYAVAGIDEELGRIEAGLDSSGNIGIFSGGF